MKVSLVGAGPGDPGLLTLKAARALRTADVLLYDYLAAPATVALAPADCERIYVGKQAGAHALGQDEINELIVRKAREGKHVVRLKGGDPFVFGRGAEEAQVLHAEGIPFEIVPGITSAIAAPAYAGIPVTHRSHNTAFTVVTGHEDPTKPESTIDWATLAHPHHTLVLLMAMGNLAHIARQLREHGLAASTPAAVIGEGTRPQQRTLVATLATLADEAERAGIRAPAVVVIGEVVRLRDEVRWFDRQPLFGKRVLITRPAHQAESFANELLEHGAAPLIAPLVAIAPPDDEPAARQAVEFVSEYRWLVFTSRNGVDAFFDHLRTLGADARYLRFVQVAAIGPATSQALRARGIEPDLVPHEFVGEALAAALRERIAPGERVLVFRAQEARDVLASTLRDHGARVDVVAAYKTVAVRPDRFDELLQSADVVTFTSPSTITSFVQNSKHAAAALDGKIVACIGPVTQRAATDAGLRVDVVAREYTAAGLLAALEESAASTGSVSIL